MDGKSSSKCDLLKLLREQVKTSQVTAFLNVALSQFVWCKLAGTVVWDARRWCLLESRALGGGACWHTIKKPQRFKSPKGADWKSGTQGIHWHWNKEWSLLGAAGFATRKARNPFCNRVSGTAHPRAPEQVCVAQTCLHGEAEWELRTSCENNFLDLMFSGCDHVMIIIFKTEQNNSLDSMSHQEATQSRSKKGRDSGDRKSQAQQLVFICQLWGLKTVTKLGYSRSSSETCLSEWMGGGNDIIWPRNQRGSWHPRHKSWMFLWSFKLDPQPAWLEGLIRLKNNNNNNNSHSSLTRALCIYMHTCTCTQTHCPHNQKSAK